VFRQDHKKNEQRFKGIAASPGISIGKVFLMSHGYIQINRLTIGENETGPEKELFLHALTESKNELKRLQEQTAHSMGHEIANIFVTHQLMLDDPLVASQTIHGIENEKKSAELAFSETIEKFEATMSGFNDEDLRSRIVDLRDIKRRVIRHIQGEPGKLNIKLSEPYIIFSKELTPSDTVHLERDKVLGFATELGGKTSHAAIMARSLKIPSVVGLVEISSLAKTDDVAILDGNEGLLILHPSQKTIREYVKKQLELVTFEKKLQRLKDLPARTKDGKDLNLCANIEFLDDIATIQCAGVQGVGLFRTEYLYLSKAELPTEDEQFVEYQKIVQGMAGKPIVIRTFDLGGDKMPHSIKLPPEENPFLGLRAIRIAQSYNVDIFKNQLRAIVRASAYGNIRVMFPMISCVPEMRYCRGLLSDAQKELAARGVPMAKDIPVGAMIEVPSAAIIADLIAQECDFLSIGTNDLVQYTLAVDRGNEHVAYLYQPFNPAVLRLIRDIIVKGHQNGVWVSMCGEMASDPFATMVLLGLGLDEFSVNCVSTFLIKEIIRRVEFSECENLAEKALGFSTADEVETYLRQIMRKKFKDLAISL
jgi:phosphoenolpyruvate-protein phosphotransferase (PTS system enzyme I)